MMQADIDGRKFAYDISGQGAPAVVLETGLGADSADWAGVEAEVARFAAVFRYDRLGRGGSDPSGAPRDALIMVDDLEALLEATGVRPPYIFVGHSFGGLLGQIFAQRRRADMAGLVLVESMHPAQFEVLGPAFPPPALDDPAPLAGMRRFWTEGWRSATSTPEKIDFSASFAQAPGPGALGDLPLRILTSGSMLRIPFLPLAARPALQSRWLDLQTRLVGLSTDAVHSLWPAAGHFLQRDNPFAVVAAVRDLVA